MKRMHHKTGPPLAMWLLVIGTVLTLSMVLYACGPATPEPTPVPTLPPEPTPVPIPDQSEYIAAWEEGPHSADYDLGKGPNTMCSRCHSPQNWAPDSRPGRPPNCVTCKFPTDPELRIAATLAEGGMDFVSEEDWVGIPCAQCHMVDEHGTASEDIYWYAPISLVYEPLKTSNELCTKCHVDGTGNLGSGGNGTDHAIVLGGSAHQNFAGEWPQADRPQYCTDCHDAHSSEVKACADCHTDAKDTHAKVSFMLETVTCMACHDASGAVVGYLEEGGLFDTISITPSRSGGPPTIAKLVSHSIVWKVSCDRCHFEGNEWGLSVLTAAGAPVEAETP